MGKSQRTKGRRVERKAELMLLDRDYCELMRNPAGKDGHDITAKCPRTGKFLAVEVKNHVIWNWTNFMTQARTNAKKYGYLWAVLFHIPNSRAWLFWRQDEVPTIWFEKGSDDE